MRDSGTWAVVWAATLALASAAWADHFDWTFQQVDPGGVQSMHVAMAMRTGATWPTVFHDGSQYNLSDQVVASSLTPVGWLPTGLGGFNSPGSFVRARPGQDGRVGAAFYSEYGIRFAQSSAGGWQSSVVAASTPPGSDFAPDVDYVSGNRPVVAYADAHSQNLHVSVYNGIGWETETVIPNFGGPQFSHGEGVSLAADSLDRLGLAYTASGGVCFAFKNSLSGTWNGAQVCTTSTSDMHLSLAFGPNDEPGLAMLDGNGTLDYAWFNMQTGAWQVDNLATSVSSRRVNLAFDSTGNPALAYVDADGRLTYSINDGGGWTHTVLPSELDPESGLVVTPINYTDAALAFDAHNIPLIAYHSQQSGLLLAYDPTIPEPTSAMALLAAVGALACRRTRS